MLLHILNKIKSNYKIYVYRYILFFIAIMFIFLSIMFRSISINKIESDIIFYENAVKIEERGQTPHLSQGFKITEEKVKKIENEFQYVNFIQSSFDLWVKGRQNVAFDIVSADFVNTGVEIYDFDKAYYGVQKLELLYGNKWGKNTDEPITIVDLDTARLLFGYENVVGQILRTNCDDLTIVGVVSNTIEREQEINQARKRGDYIADYLFETHAYVPHKYYQTLDLPTYNNDIIVCDERMNPEKLKLKLKQIFEIPLEEDQVFISRQDIIDNNIAGRETFFRIIIIITSVFSILGCLNLINITLYKFKINNKNIGVSKTLNHKDQQTIRLSIFESFVESIICSIIPIVFSIIILFLVALVSGTLKFVNYYYLLAVSVSLVIIFGLILFLINTIISYISIKHLGKRLNEHL